MQFIRAIDDETVYVDADGMLAVADAGTVLKVHDRRLDREHGDIRSEEAIKLVRCGKALIANAEDNDRKATGEE